MEVEIIARLLHAQDQRVVGDILSECDQMATHFPQRVINHYSIREHKGIELEKFVLEMWEKMDDKDRYLIQAQMLIAIIKGLVQTETGREE